MIPSCVAFAIDLRYLAVATLEDVSNQAIRYRELANVPF